MTMEATQYTGLASTGPVSVSWYLRDCPAQLLVRLFDAHGTWCLPQDINALTYLQYISCRLPEYSIRYSTVYYSSYSSS